MLSAADIQNIIRIVVERVRALEAASLGEAVLTGQTIPDHPPSLLATPVPTRPTSESTSTLTLNCKLITLEQLPDTLAGVQVLQVPRRAILTPAVVDELRKRGVRLLRIDPLVTAVRRPQRILLMTAGEGHTANIDARVVIENANMTANVDALVEHVSSHAGLAIWSSSRPFAAVVAAQADPRLKVLLLPTLADLDRALSQANPNLIVIDDHRWNLGSVANLVRSWGDV